jgi:hypothetical protein
MSMRGQISIILFCLFLSSAQGQLHDTPKAAIASGISTVLLEHGLDPATTNIVTDSIWRQLVPERSSLTATSVLYVKHIEITRVGFNDRQFVVSGAIVSLRPPKAPEEFYFTAGISGANSPEVLKEGTAPIADTVETGFWDSVLQPTLVTLGAVAIIALFFLIRS